MSDAPHLHRVTASGYFGLCDSCGADIEGRPVTYYVEDVRPLPDVGRTAHRYHCAACAQGEQRTSTEHER